MESEETINRKNWYVEWTVRKWLADDWEAGGEPYAVNRAVENLLLNDGINVLLKILGGTGGTAFSNTNARLKVGNSSTAVFATQTDLQGGTTAEKAMDATFPTVVNQTITWRSTFSASEALFSWQEVGVKNGAGAISGSVKMLNRKVQNFGIKPNTEIWELSLSITVS